MVDGWEGVAAVWGALDPTSGTVFLFDEQCQRNAELSEHARAIRAKGDWIPGIINTAARGRTELDGWRLTERYRVEGLKLEQRSGSGE